MLRLHFTAQDLMSVRFATEPAPLVELGLALSVLREPHADPLLGRWRRTAAGALTQRTRPLLQLVPLGGAAPTFLDPPVGNLAEGLDTVLSIGPTRASAELRRVFAAERSVAPWVADLARRDRRAWDVLARALPAAHTALLTPYWPQIRASFAADLAWRGRVALEEGLKAMLAALFADSRWDGTCLSIPSPRCTDVRLAGRGLTLMPSAFWRGFPLRCDHPDGSLLLVYPALTPLPLVGEPETADPLAALLGPTRALVLQLLTRPYTTTALARDLGISAASASVHAKTLRAAGLVTTEREGKHVRHTCTPLGARLLAAPAVAGR
ncbi:DNA-binding transcriptional ArsR family regulator [Streptacidiphilus sp. MAP12-16]|uniref:ArsR/SmtB family transcription factor n=1 Tax=Streptacidiphilus sp. MAP12-16 TaxID=3156300 RepID=UPI003518662D